MLFHVLLPMFGTFLCTAPSILRARIRGQAKRMAPEHHEVVIIGGGTGGLFTAKKLLGAGVDDVIVLESRPVVGGRVSTTRDDAGNPMFNNFAWRVSEENTMMRALAEELGLNLILQTTPPPNDAAKGHSEGKHGGLSPMRDESNATEREIAPKRAPLSDFARASLNSASAADMQDRESGYAGRTSQVRYSQSIVNCRFIDFMPYYTSDYGYTDLMD